MRATGIVRYVDELGRVVIPKIIREEMDICENDQLDVLVDLQNGHVIFSKCQTDATLAEQGLESIKEYFGHTALDEKEAIDLIERRLKMRKDEQ